MKIFILTIIAMLGTAAVAFAKEPETITLRAGSQITTVHGKLTVKFISVIEDSRCPADAKCVWAGNAKIQISVRSGKRAAKTLELNSTLKPQSIVYEGYEITFVDLNPKPGVKTRPRLMSSVATISVAKH